MKIYPILRFVVQFSQFLIENNRPPSLLAVKIVQPENSNQVAGAQLQVLNACTL
jgi:hypothetical protein